MPQTSRPAASAGSRRADSIRQRASRSWSGMPRTSSIMGWLAGHAWAGTLSSRPAIRPSDLRRPRPYRPRREDRVVDPGTRATAQPSSRTESAHPRAGLDPAAGGDNRARADRGPGVDLRPRARRTGRGRSGAPGSPPCPRGCPSSPAGSAPACRCPSSSRRAAARRARRRPAAGRPRARSRPRCRRDQVEHRALEHVGAGVDLAGHRLAGLLDERGHARPSPSTSTSP